MQQNVEPPGQIDRTKTGVFNTTENVKGENILRQFSQIIMNNIFGLSNPFLDHVYTQRNTE